VVQQNVAVNFLVDLEETTRCIKMMPSVIKDIDPPSLLFICTALHLNTLRTGDADLRS